MSKNTENWREQAVCLNETAATALFHSAALDYAPTAREIKASNPAEHAANLDARAAAEAAAIDVCFGCPVMLLCEKSARETRVAGVAGGLTETERYGDTLDVIFAEENVEVEEVLVHDRDRGPRGLINASAVDRMSAAGLTTVDIARELGCATRSITRSRARVGVTAETTATVKTTADLSLVAAEIDADLRQATTTPSAPATPVCTSGARKPSGAMAAIYNVLADGQWHHRDVLVTTGAAHVLDADALAWWERANQITTPAGKIINPAKADTPMAERVAAGSRAQVLNSLSASARTRKRTERGGPAGTDADLYRINATTAIATPLTASTSV